MKTSRTDFNESWLYEMPTGIGPVNNAMFFKIIKRNIEDYISHGGTPVNLSNNYKKIVGQQIAYYWHENVNNEIDIGIELTVKPQTLIVNGVARDPNGSEVYATDLYNIILNDNYRAIRLMSDDMLSDQGLALWKRLLTLGNTISVYDRENPKDLISITSDQELEKFYSLHNDSYKQYQYVLSESNVKLAEMRSYFNTRRMRELSGLGTED